VLHELFTQASMLQRRSPILVAINKTDLATAQDTDAITAQLEREMYPFNLILFQVLIRM
jgi:signal recognition particle receptor subunit beta